MTFDSAQAATSTSVDAAPPAPSGGVNTAHSGSHDPVDGNDHPVVPRPRPGFRSRRQGAAFDRLQIFAGVLRAGLGCVGVFGALLYLPIQMATPVLAGVSMLMMVTGTTNTWRAVRDAPGLRHLSYLVGGGCLAVVIGTAILTGLLGAGSLGPVAAARAAARAAAEDRARHAGPPAVRFEPAP